VVKITAAVFVPLLQFIEDTAQSRIFRASWVVLMKNTVPTVLAVTLSVTEFSEWLYFGENILFRYLQSFPALSAFSYSVL